MKIAVCFKLIPDYEQLPSDDWRKGCILRPLSNMPDTKFLGTVFGFFDEGALETALRIKDQDKNTELIAISLGQEYKIYTQYLLANGYDRVCYLKANSDFDSQNTAKELSLFIKDQNFDLILMGENAGPMDTGSVPYLLAHHMDCPIINKISDITLQNDSLILTRETSENIEQYEIEYRTANSPTIAVISNAKHPYLRLASYLNKEKVKNIKADVLEASDGKNNVRFIATQSKDRDTSYIDKEQLAKMLIKGGMP